MIVMKFGGTSTGDRDRMERMAQLVVAEDRPSVVVVSAMGDTTDRLLRAADHAERGQWAEAQAIVEALRAHHLAAVEEPEVQVLVQQLLVELSSVLHGVLLLRESTPRSRALIASFGERLAAPIAAAWIRSLGRPAEPVDARNLVITDGRFEEAEVDMEATQARLERRLRPMLQRNEIPVVTGFLGATPDGITTTLGRGGSDYSASLLGGLLGAEEVWIWTDVDGILTADPRLVTEARRLERVSYREAAEMSYFGARVLHPRTMRPAMTRGIPIRIRSTSAPDSPGTVVGQDTDTLPDGVKTVTSIRSMALVTVDGRGMAGLPGVARRIFEVTQQTGVNVVMISQASSEQTVSLVVRAAECDRLLAALESAFALELQAGVIDAIQADHDVAVLSIIGQGMAGKPGVSGRLFGALGSAGVNVLAIAQGASELSISVAIRDRHVVRAVRAVHTAFGLTRIVHLVLVGCGRVGRALLQMLAELRDRYREEHNLELRLVALVSSRLLLLDEHGLDPATAADDIAHGIPRPSDEVLVNRLVGQRFTDAILIDVSAADLTDLHRAALEVGFHVVTANKVPLSGSMDSYYGLVRARNASRVRYGYETTFGAGLPVLHTLKELLHTGDALERVLGCFSGTLGFLCTRLEDGLSLVEAVGEAEQLGYTEPDPREDLSGRDVARKALIIARAMGWRIEPHEVELEPLVDGLEGGLASALIEHGPALERRVAEAAERGEVLRYVAEITGNAARVGLRTVPKDSPIGSLRGPDNMMVFQTRRYHDYPLVIRGPGAGAEVTAAGVLGDILRIAQP